MIETIPLGLQTTYQDVLDRHRRRPVPDLEGSLLQTRDGYWVARQRMGDRVLERRIGPDTPENRKRVEVIKRQQDDLQAWRQEVSALVAQLRAARLPVPAIGTGKLINALSRTGLFEKGGVLAGTHAFGLYALELGVRLKDALAMTEDVDVAATRSVSIITDAQISLFNPIDAIGLQPVASPMEKHPVRWSMQDGTVLDILTPRQRGGEAIVHHKGLGVWAQALPYLEFSLTDPIEAVVLYREGILVRIPAPERYAIHKLIVASARTGTHRAKSQKDLQQAAALVEVLAEARPYELQTAFNDAMSRGSKWQQAIQASLKQRPDVAAIIEMRG
ncbi:GSU2403 family nucleotidyltransferase fold protein [Pseudaestuariivita rosea]|uniref:GSU2403 family nucleotidyltransferase fold protein n=1 Tax=Pseudaestuariivita rosea TaxID=2763263 RepID=UPI001ABB984F|nr:GSU2403 family nucleotidyltransferase fold protein [Pseudaestuariivita rosea]